MLSSPLAVKLDIAVAMYVRACDRILSGPLLLQLYMDFKIILHSFCPRGGEVPLETFYVGSRSSHT